MRSAWRQRSEVGRDRDDVVFGKLCNRLLHEGCIGAGARSVLNPNQLPRDVDRLQSGNARHLAEAGQRVAMANRALNRLAGAARFDERLSSRDAARRYVRDETGMWITDRGPVGVLRNLNDATSD